METSREDARLRAVAALTLTAPFWMLELEQMEPGAAERTAAQWAVAAARHAGAGPRRRIRWAQTPEARTEQYEALSRGVAALARPPGGVRFLDIVWCKVHSGAGRVAPLWESVCRYCVMTPAGAGAPADLPVPLRHLHRIMYREDMR